MQSNFQNEKPQVIEVGLPKIDPAKVPPKKPSLIKSFITKFTNKSKKSDRNSSRSKGPIKNKKSMDVMIEGKPYVVKQGAKTQRQHGEMSKDSQSIRMDGM